MSAFLVENETINKVVSYMPSEFVPCKDRDTLGVELLKMNHAALKVRYGDEMPESVEFRFKPKVYYGNSKCTVLKAMRCLRYQCAEGNVPESDLFKKLDEAINRLAIEIVDALPEYESAEWSG